MTTDRAAILKVIPFGVLMDPHLILIGAAMLVMSILLSPLSSRVGMPVLLIFLVVGMLMGEDGAGASDGAATRPADRLHASELQVGALAGAAPVFGHTSLVGARSPSAHGLRCRWREVKGSVS